MEYRIRSYSFGFNGKEKDNEVSGEGNSYDYGARELDPRLGRWWKIDPKAVQYPHQSPYCSFDNNPIFHTDPTGKGVEGDYYGRNGKYLGSDGIKDDKVYVVDAIEGGISATTPVGLKGGGFSEGTLRTLKFGFHKELKAELLPITHTQFQKLAGLASKEDRSNEDAIFATANAQANRMEKKMKANQTFDQIFDSFNSDNAKGPGGLHGFMLVERPRYIKYWSTTPVLRNQNKYYVQGQAAVINAWSSQGFDNTNGATGWDGAEWDNEGTSAYTRLFGGGFIWDNKALIGADAQFNQSNPSDHLVGGEYKTVITAAYGNQIYWKPKPRE